MKAYGNAGGVAQEVLSAIRIITAYNGHEKEAKRLVEIQLLYPQYTFYTYTCESDRLWIT